MSESLVIPSIPIDESSTVYPTVKIEGQLQQLLVAPGVNPTPLAKQIKPAPNLATATRTVTTGIFSSFKNAINAYKKIRTGQRLSRYDDEMYTSRIDLRQMPNDPNLQGAYVLQQVLDQIDTTDAVFGPDERTYNAAKAQLDDFLAGNRPPITFNEAISLVNRFSNDNTPGLSGDTNNWKGVIYLQTGARHSSILRDALETLNKATNAEESYRRLYLASKDDIDNGIPLDPNVEATLNNAKLNAAVEWANAASHIISAYQSAASTREDALRRFRIKKGKASKDDFVVNGMRAELFKLIIDQEIANNPFALASVGEAKRAVLELRARSMNIRRKAVNARLTSGGRRNTGLYDNDPDVLDPWKGSSPPLAPRSPDVISQLSLRHKSEGIFGDATKGVSPFTDEQILMLSQMVEQMEGERANGKAMGPIGTPMEGTEYPVGIGQAHLATIWYYNGWDSLPVVVNKEEAISILSQVDSDGQPVASVMTRGVAGTPANQVQFINDAIRGDRFIPGQGHSAAGRGEYFTQNPVSWSSYHGGAGGTLIGVITKDMNIVSQESFKEAISVGLEPGVIELHEIFGYPGQIPGTSTRTRSIPKFFTQVGLTRDPITGQYDQNELLQLEQEINDVTKIGNPLAQGTSISDGSWGKATLESTIDFSDDRVTPNSKVLMLPEVNPQATVEEIKEASEQRAYYNAWTRQNLMWMLELAKMHRDESGPDSAAAKQYNERLRKAMAMLVHMTAENRASLMGVDAIYTDTNRPGTLRPMFTKSSVWAGYSINGGVVNNGLSQGAASRILVLNRSGMIYYEDPVQHYRDWRDILNSIVYPDGTTAMRPGMGW